jgi:hypothetical protein
MDWLWSLTTTPAPPPPPPVSNSTALVVYEPPWVAVARNSTAYFFPAPIWGDIAILTLLGGMALAMILYLMWEISDLGLRICRIAILAVMVLFSLVFFATICRLSMVQYGDQYVEMGSSVAPFVRWLWESALIIGGGGTQPIKT